MPRAVESTAAATWLEVVVANKAALVAEEDNAAAAGNDPAVDALNKTVEPVPTGRAPQHHQIPGERAKNNRPAGLGLTCD